MARKKAKKTARKQTRAGKPRRRGGGANLLDPRSLPGVSPASMLRDGEPIMPGKMSEALLEVAAPTLAVLPEDGGLDAFRRVLTLAAMAWNISRYDDPQEREEEIHEAAAHFGPATAEERELLRDLLTQMAARAAHLWPRVKAIVTKVVVYEDESGQIRVTAISRVPG